MIKRFVIVLSIIVAVLAVSSETAFARTYSPVHGRFLQRDPIMRITPSVGLYTYVRNNPVIYVDPMGRQEQNLNCCPTKLKIMQWGQSPWSVHGPHGDEKKVFRKQLGFHDVAGRGKFLTPEYNKQGHWYGFNFAVVATCTENSNLEKCKFTQKRALTLKKQNQVEGTIGSGFSRYSKSAAGWFDETGGLDIEREFDKHQLGYHDCPRVWCGVAGGYYPTEWLANFEITIEGAGTGAGIKITKYLGMELYVWSGPPNLSYAIYVYEY